MTADVVTLELDWAAVLGAVAEDDAAAVVDLIAAMLAPIDLPPQRLLAAVLRIEPVVVAHVKAALAALDAPA